MSGSRAGGGAASAAIPASARKAVQNVKDVVGNNSEDEIYAMLKECNMDANETVQRLLNQEVFHEVKRKRDRKKEGAKEIPENRSRLSGGGPPSRASRSGGFGRGNSLPRFNSNEFNGGRGKPFVARENGNVNSNTRMVPTSSVPSLSTSPSYGQSKGFTPGVSSTPTSTAVGSPSLPNGNVVYSRPQAIPQGTWVAAGPGHATMADIVKANGAPPAPAVSLVSLPSASQPVVSTPAVQQYIPSSVSPLPSLSTGVYSSSTDPVLHPSLDPRTTGNPGAIKREVGTVGNQRPKADRPSSLNADTVAVPSSPSQSPQVSQTSIPSVTSSSTEADALVTSPRSPSVSVSPNLPDHAASLSVATETGSSTVSQPRQSSSATTATSGSRTALVGSQFNSRPVYQPQQQPVGTLKATGAGLEWKPKTAAQSPVSMAGGVAVSTAEAVHSPVPSSASVETVLLSVATSKLSIKEDQPVIIPNHLQVPESERTRLSFGSFGAGFGFTSSFVSEDSGKSSVSVPESSPSVELPVEQPSASSVTSTSPVALSQGYVHQPISVPEESLVSSNEAVIVSMPPPTSMAQPDIAKPDVVVQQGPHYPYLPTVPNYPGFGLMPQIPTGQYTYESAESQAQDVSRLPSLMPYTDPAASYYTPAFRPASDGERYPPFISSNASSKYNGNMGLINMSGPSLPSSHESGNAVLTSSVPSVQTTQTGNAQTVPTMPQQPLPLHPYTGQPTGAPLGHHFANVFGYQYMQPSYAYMHTHPPYQHNFTTNSGYPQPPAGSSYPPAASNYPPGGATTVKYLPPYKPATAAGNAPHSGGAAGYGGYATAPSGYAGNASVTAGSATGYDDVGVQQYKDNLYIPSQQAEGSTVWIQAQLSRDMAGAGMQTSSYYNLPGQGQHTAYGHTQQPAHTHTHPGAYASLYHPSPSGPAPTAHQLLQQPQALGAGPAGSAQAGGYQQTQRAQQTWTNSY